jgi:hypothetical protein
MSCFALSKTCKHLSSAMACDLWGEDGDKRKMHWRKWSEIDQPKYAGSMGFRDVEMFNIAMLGKQGWRPITNPNSLSLC